MPRSQRVKNAKFDAAIKDCKPFVDKQKALKRTKRRNARRQTLSSSERGKKNDVLQTGKDNSADESKLDLGTIMQAAKDIEKLLPHNRYTPKLRKKFAFLKS